MSTTRFPLIDFRGTPKAFYMVDEETVDAAASTTVVVRNPAHFIFVADASGSMYGQMDDLRLLVVKLLTLEEYRDANVKVSVLSFADSGDLVTHASRVNIGDFMSPKSKALKEVMTLGTRGCTCISQGLQAVPALLRDEELTAVTLLSDGFANDRSPGDEKRIIDGVVADLAKRKNVFVNTVSLGSWADFKLLSYIANACSGVCFQAPSAKEVFDNVHETMNLVTGDTSPAMSVTLNGAGYAVFVSRQGGKIIGGSADLLIRGLRSEDDKVIYRYKKVEEAVYNASNAPICGEGSQSVAPILAFAKAQLAEGYVNRAKYALAATRNETLLLAHARALVSTEIAAMSAAIESAALNGVPASHVIGKTYGLPNANTLSVLGVLSLLTDYVSDIEVDVDALRNGYKKRSVKRIPGVRLDDGTVETPWVKTAYRYNGGLVKVSSFDINRNNATVNMLLNRPVNLVKADDGSVISDVAGVKLDLRSFNNYTIVGDGTLNVGQISIRIGNKRLFRSLVSAGVLPDGTFDPKATYEIVLEGRPLIAYDATFSPDMLDGVFTRVAGLKVLASILAASMKGQSDALTPEQVAELKKHYLSTSLYFSPPTTNEYADLKKALAEGIVDTRLSYKVDFGNPDMLNLGELYSANAYLARRFTVSVNGVEDKKPKFDLRWEDGIKYGIKPVGAKLVLGPVDDLMYPIFLEFLGLAQTGAIAPILAEAGLDADAQAAFMAAVSGTGSKDTQVEVLTDARKAVDAAIDRIFRDSVSSMVFYIGATGLVPDEFNARALTAEQVKEKYPRLVISKAESEGTFYVVGTVANPVVLCVYVKAENFSTGKVLSEVEEAA